MWVLVAIIPTILWSLVNFIDKAIISKFFKDGGETAVITTAFAGLVLALFILIFKPGHITDIGWFYRLIAFLNGFIFVIAFMPYCKALEIDDASRAVMVYQTIPVFGFILGYVFLHEVFTTSAIIGGLLIIGGSIVVMLESAGGKWHIKRKTLLLMLLSSFMTSLHQFIFKYISIEESFWSTGFWVYLGMAVCGIIIYLIPYYRRKFNDATRGNVGLVLGFGTFTELLSIIGVTIIVYVSLKIPLALVQTINGFQPFVIIVLGFILTKFLSKYFNESFNKEHLFIKISAFIIMLAGVIIINNF